MRYTLLEVVRSYLAATDGFFVDSIDDTLEGGQAADIARDVYNEMLDDIPEWQFREEILQLEALGDSDRPNYLRIPERVRKIQDSLIFYNAVQSTSTATLKYDPIPYISNQDFMNLLNGVSDLVDNTTIITDASGVKFNIYTNRAPQQCTSFDGELLVFDSYDSAVEMTLQSHKSQVIGSTSREFVREDSWVIDLPESLQITYLHNVKAAASEYLRQEALVRDVTKGRAGLIRARLNHKTIGSTSKRSRSYGRR